MEQSALHARHRDNNGEISRKHGNAPIRTGILAPAGTPADIVGKLNAGINAGLRSPEMQTRFKELVAEARPGTPADFAAFIATEPPKWAAMAKLAGIEPE